MREILFRGKRIDNGKWVYGYFYKIWNEGYIMRGMINNIPDMVGIRLDTVCQFTGFKDVNGAMIFDGDIISVMGYKENPIGEVSFKNGQWFVGSDDFENMGFRNELYFWATKRRIEVIGNIFDNTELLKE
jgi:uncharacterized phage protein (TIGR01671 family)